MQCNGQRKRCAQRWAGVACKQREDALGQIVQHDGGRCHHSAAQRAGIDGRRPTRRMPVRAGRKLLFIGDAPLQQQSDQHSHHAQAGRGQRRRKPAHGIGIGLDGMRQHVGERHRKHHAPGKPHGKRHHPRPRAFEQQNHKPAQPRGKACKRRECEREQHKHQPLSPSICGSRAVSAPGGRGVFRHGGAVTAAP